ncbi:hypothetical protein PTKU15_84060 [Paraburkholderia terrae]|nr:hypothetical protein PTKU15_84060 [Paraburkholderia terrae]
MQSFKRTRDVNTEIRTGYAREKIPSRRESLLARNREFAEPTREATADLCTAHTGLVAPTTARVRVTNSNRAMRLPIRLPIIAKTVPTGPTSIMRHRATKR